MQQRLASTLAVMALALALPLAPSARASDCLTQIDGITVEYDLPASEAVVGTQLAEAYPGGAKPGFVEDTSGLRHAPAGRPGAAHLSGGDAEIRSTPMMPRDNRLNADQRSRLIGLLRQARAAEALGHEGECSDLLRQAVAITGAHG
jgi:hypothetical protein